MDELTWQRSLPRKWMAAGVVIRDADGRVLMVEPTYKDAWEIPGGVVEADESPRAACRRELHEELGLPLEPGRCCAGSGSTRRPTAPSR
jgi:ADP-ribose pyrophosphatase YjhB (NUDIX family)